MALQRRLECFLLLALQLTAALAAVNGGGDVTVYWGRNKYEGSLRQACDTGMYTTVIISFLVVFGYGKYQLDLSGHPLAGVGDDIEHCKSKGILVLVSISGTNNSTSHFLPSAQSAADLAEYLWTAFLGGARSGVSRPFGDAVVDGVDFFIDQGATEHYDELARRLHAYTKHDRGWGMTLTATTRCGYPDQRLEAALDTGLFNRIHASLQLVGYPTYVEEDAFSWWEN